MESKFNKSPSVPILGLEESRKYFSNFLKNARADKKTIKEVASILGLKIDAAVRKWENAETLPKDESNLRDIARVYGVSLEALTGAFRISKQARQMEINMRKGI